MMNTEEEEEEVIDYFVRLGFKGGIAYNSVRSHGGYIVTRSNK